jgi:hypothetical protein
LVKSKISGEETFVGQIQSFCAFFEAYWYAKYQELGADGGHGPPMSC